MPFEAFRLVSEDSDSESLVAIASQSRPELLAQSATIQEAETRVRQERMRPWLPLVAIGYSGGVFGGGSSLVADDFSSLKGRSDFDVMAVWNVQNLGFGNYARVRRARAVVSQAVAGYDRVRLNQSGVSGHRSPGRSQNRSETNRSREDRTDSSRRGFPGLEADRPIKSGVRADRSRPWTVSANYSTPG